MFSLIALAKLNLTGRSDHADVILSFHMFDCFMLQYCKSYISITMAYIKGLQIRFSKA